MGRANVPNQKLANRRLRVGPQRRCPLRLVLHVLPRLLVLGDVLRSDLGERFLRLSLSRRGTAGGSPRRDRIDSLLHERPVLPGLLPSFGQGHRRETSQPHLSLPSARCHSEYPASRARRRDLQGQPVRPSNAPSTRARQPPDLERRQFFGLPWHGGLIILPLTYPHKMVGWCWTLADAAGRSFSQITYEKSPFRGLVQRLAWRSRRDSNPRCRFCPHTPLAGEHLRPLGHSSVGRDSSGWPSTRGACAPTPGPGSGRDRTPCAGPAPRAPCISR